MIDYHVLDVTKPQSVTTFKIWFDEKYLYDFVSDFLDNCKDDQVQGQLLRLMVNNLSKPIG